MFAYILFICLVVQIALAIKLFISNPTRKLNIYLALIPGLFVFNTILEINLYYVTDVALGNKLYSFYQYQAFTPIVFLTLSVSEYIKTYSKKYRSSLLYAINALVILINCLWVALLVFTGPSARIWLARPGMWSIDHTSFSTLFYFHTYSSMCWLLMGALGFLYLAIIVKSRQKKWWFSILACFQLVATASILYLIGFVHNNNSPFYDLSVSIPSTIEILLQSWVLSSFTLFDVTPKNIYAEVLGSISDWIIVLDKNGKIEYLNKVALSKTGFSIYSIINKNIDDIIEVKKNENVHFSSWNSLQNSLHNNFVEIFIQFKSSKKLYNLQSSLKKITLADGGEVFLWILIDTTRIEALKLNKETIEAKNAMLKKAYDDTKLILNITSHDLKTPLKTIIELTSLIKKEHALPIPNRSEEYLGYIDVVSTQALLLATQMIEYMRLGVIEKKRSLTKMSSIFEMIKQSLFLEIEKSTTKIIYTGPEEIFCDARQIQELLFNLIDNSIKYHADELPLIEIEVTEYKAMYNFSIKDNGIGIQEDFLPQLFSQYSREEKKVAHGNGIGLYLCKSIIEANGGTINIANNLTGKGIVILFSIAKF